MGAMEFQAPRRLLRLQFAAVALLLAACAGITPPPAAVTSSQTSAAWQKRQAALLAIVNFKLQGRLAERGLTGTRADLSWDQQGEHFEVRLSGPLGVGALLLSGTPDAMTIRTKDGFTQTRDASEFMRHQLGWSLPVSQLRYWVLGLPAPGETPTLVIDDQGRAANLREDGWQIDYAEYQTSDSLELPRKIDLADGTHSFRLVIDQWSEARPDGT